MARNLAQILEDIFAKAKAATSFLIELGPLTLSIDKAVEGETLVINVLGATAGGTVTLVAPDGMTFDPVALTITGKPTTVGDYDIALREAHPFGSNSPRLSTAKLTITAKPVVPVGGVIWDPAQVVWDPAQVVWGGGGTVPTPGTIRVNAGQPVPSVEGSGGRMIRVNAGQPQPSTEGTASQMIRVTAGQPVPLSEGTATLIRVTPGQPASSNEGN